jgi:hypothetical protein
MLVNAFLKGGEMKKTVVWATACLFALSLTGAAMGQREEKATEVMPPLMETPSAGPAEKAAAPESYTKTSKRKTASKANKQTSSKKTATTKRKKARTAKKVV